MRWKCDLDQWVGKDLEAEGRGLFQGYLPGRTEVNHGRPHLGWPVILLIFQPIASQIYV
jgi:hypothetical protein